MLEEETKTTDKILKDNNDSSSNRMLQDKGVGYNIANMGAIWTGIPPQKLMETEQERILSMCSKLGKMVMGKDLAINKLHLLVVQGGTIQQNPLRVLYFW